MALRFRKSFKIGKGLRLNVSKRGVGMSVGKNGLRKSIHSTGSSTSSIGIPGTGLSYRKQSSLKKAKRLRNKQSTALGSTRQGNSVNENEAIVAEYHHLVNKLTTLQQQEVQSIPWTERKNTPAPFNKHEQGPLEKQATDNYKHYQPTLIDRILSWRATKKRKYLQEAITAAKEQDQRTYEKWKKQTTLANRVLNGDLEAYKEVLEMNEQFTEMSNRIKIELPDEHTAEITVQTSPKEIIPNRQLSLTKTGKVSKRKLGKKAYFSIVQTFICGHALWIARHLFATLPIENCIVHMTEKSIDKATGHPKKRVQLSVKYEREIVDQLNVQQLDPYQALENFEHHVDFLVTKGFRSVKKLSH